jgi:hypothetical protein
MSIQQCYTPNQNPCDVTEASCSRDGLRGLREQKTVAPPVNRTLESGVEKAWVFQWRLQSSNESLAAPNDRLQLVSKRLH